MHDIRILQRLLQAINSIKRTNNSGFQLQIKPQTPRPPRRRMPSSTFPRWGSAHGGNTDRPVFLLHNLFDRPCALLEVGYCRERLPLCDGCGEETGTTCRGGGSAFFCICSSSCLCSAIVCLMRPNAALISFTGFPVKRSAFS